MKQELNPAVAVVIVVIALVVVGVLWVRATGHSGANAKPSDNPAYAAHEQGAKSK